MVTLINPVNPAHATQTQRQVTPSYSQDEIHGAQLG